MFIKLYNSFITFFEEIYYFGIYVLCFRKNCSILTVLEAHNQTMSYCMTNQVNSSING